MFLLRKAISGVRSWGLSGRGAVWGQDGKINIDFDSLPENLFQNLFFSVSRRFKRVDGKQSQRKGEDEFLRGAPREGQVHTSLKIFSKVFQSAPEHVLRACHILPE